MVKAKVFLLERDAPKQFVIKGGFFKELIENKKIDIEVPLEGKIKIIEKEIRVIDEFAEKKSEESLEKESSEKEAPEISKEDYEKVLKENEQGKKSEAESQDGTEAEEVLKPRTRGDR